MKTVFILGAGASKYTGAPVMNDFFDRAEEINRANKIKTGNLIKSFEIVLDAIYDLKSIHSKSYLDLDNIETVFEAIEMGLIIGGIKGRSEIKMKNLKKSLIDMIVITLEKTIKFPKDGNRIYLPKAHEFLLNFINQIIAQKKLNPNSFSFITFNYDLILDSVRALMHNRNFDFDYCFYESHSSTNIPLLKLHGSLNWGLCKKCKSIRDVTLKEPEFHYYKDDPYYAWYEMGSDISRNKCHVCRNNFDDFPIIVPPTWNKTSFQKTISNIWKKAALVLKEAENIFIIGYSLPETDMFFKYLFAIGTEGRTRLKKIVVVNPDKDKSVKERFYSFIGRAIKKRLKFYNEDKGYFGIGGMADVGGLALIKAELEESYEINLEEQVSVKSFSRKSMTEGF